MDEIGDAISSQIAHVAQRYGKAPEDIRVMPRSVSRWSSITQRDLIEFARRLKDGESEEVGVAAKFRFSVGESQQKGAPPLCFVPVVYLEAPDDE